VNNKVEAWRLAEGYHRGTENTDKDKRDFHELFRLAIYALALIGYEIRCFVVSRIEKPLIELNG
jgi:hypothetical protein